MPDSQRPWTATIQSMISEYLLPTLHNVIDDKGLGEEAIHHRLDAVMGEIRVIRSYLGEPSLNELMKYLSTVKEGDGKDVVELVRELCILSCV